MILVIYFSFSKPDLKLKNQNFCRFEDLMICINFLLGIQPLVKLEPLAMESPQVALQHPLVHFQSLAMEFPLVAL